MDWTVLPPVILHQHHMGPLNGEIRFWWRIVSHAALNSDLWVYLSFPMSQRAHWKIADCEHYQWRVTATPSRSMSNDEWGSRRLGIAFHQLLRHISGWTDSLTRLVPWQLTASKLIHLQLIFWIHAKNTHLLSKQFPQLVRFPFTQKNNCTRVRFEANLF